MTQSIASQTVPLHIAIVPDGNRRWAKRGGNAAWKGHEAGASRIEELTREALRKGVKYLTIWGSSVDNLTKRPLEEKRHLLRIYETYFTRLIESNDIFENQTRIMVLGRWEEQFPQLLKQILRKGMELTKSHANTFLNFLLAYNGDDELLAACNSIARSQDTANEEGISEQTLRNHLTTGALPDVDLLIRTGVEGDPHNSTGFMMWHTRNAQYYFSEKMFPDFTVEEFSKALEDYANRVRRFGR